ncbi:DUF799 domain-containing protein [Erwinia psidii]|uniref:DUF799 domain-containing protein n=1 Tax=Erwinia psidii TaxID=69224 RepID=A0A3N6SNX9_9GAMM|nr:DUF799 domain-containing protein [Erwinia psidii]MCX8957710.1 hypothetical protein [Erwinia psidii]MCX8960765.1 hypothetical protein [Erwinia psidii]MCX8963989.1 hypothetical protein [Erwinia psidii]RQM39476.1 hypothetical protein EB241_03330 [Erwinia psidii]
MKNFLAIVGLLAVVTLTGCAKKTPPYDYTAFRESKPASILVLPAENHATDINAAHSFASLVTQPLAESGYYVFPVAVVEETFKQNGLTSASDIRNVSAAKLHGIFNADAALYIDITEYGTKFIVVDSMTKVTATAKLVDLRTGKTVWSGAATATDNESNHNGTQGLLGLVVNAAVKQITSNITDKTHDVAALTSDRLLSANTNGGILPGPRAKTAIR